MVRRELEQRDLGFTLLENGIDFLEKAVEELRGDPTARNLKYAVLHLNAGVALLLKERLRQLDWSQLFRDPVTADEHLLETGDFVSVGLWDLIERLDASGVEISYTTRRTLRRLSKLRNRIEHFKVADSTESVSAVAARALAYALDFIGSEIEPVGIEEPVAVNLAAIRDGLREIDAFVEERRVSTNQELGGYEAVLDCYRCGEDFFAIGDGGVCFFCGYRTDAAEGAAEYALLVLGSTPYDVTKGGDWAVGPCPECGGETLVDTGAVGAETPALRWACFQCGNAWADGRLQTCGSCGSLYSGTMYVCDDCFEYKISGPD